MLRKLTEEDVLTKEEQKDVKGGLWPPACIGACFKDCFYEGMYQEFYDYTSLLY